MATRQPLGAEPHPTPNSESLDGLVRILRARRLKAAGTSKPHRQIGLVAPQREQCHPQANISVSECSAGL